MKNQTGRTNKRDHADVIGSRPNTAPPNETELSLFWSILGHKNTVEAKGFFPLKPVWWVKPWMYHKSFYDTSMNETCSYFQEASAPFRTSPDMTRAFPKVNSWSHFIGETFVQWAAAICAGLGAVEILRLRFLQALLAGFTSEQLSLPPWHQHEASSGHSCGFCIDNCHYWRCCLLQGAVSGWRCSIAYSMSSSLMYEWLCCESCC